MLKVNSHVGLASQVRISNVWLLTDAMDRRFLIDTGHFTERFLLKWHLWKAGVKRKGDLTGVILTHRHSDHAGNAAWLRKEYDAPIICHAADARILTGKAPRTKMVPRAESIIPKFLCYWEDYVPSLCQVDETFTEGVWKYGFTIIHAPGHTEGSSLLYHEPTRTLFSGDTILASHPPLRSWESLRLAMPSFSQNARRCHLHVKKFLKSLPRTEALCSGHGPAVCNCAHEKLLKLLEN